MFKKDVLKNENNSKQIKKRIIKIGKHHEKVKNKSNKSQKNVDKETFKK